MPIEFRCTGCQRLLRTADDTAGKQARCPECGAVMVVPGAAVFPEAGPQAAASRETAAPTEAPSGPASGAGPESPYAPLFSDVQAYAASRVAGPSTALIVSAAIGLVWSALATLNNLAHMDAVERMFRAHQMAFPFPIGRVVVGMGTVQVLFTIFILIGALKMKRLESYGLAMASAILAMIPCTFGPCCVLGLPFGIWALVVLSDVHVRAAFRT